MPPLQRKDQRAANALRSISLTADVNEHAEGSCLARFGATEVLCTATVEERVAFWRRGKGLGWITAEYAMLPRATKTRNDRESVRGRQSGRSQEIQRLIGRSLRAVCDLKALGEHQIRLDCDVLQADGGTRVAAINGSWVALHRALCWLAEKKRISGIPLKGQVLAISCGLLGGETLLDLDYQEDSSADADMNFVFTDKGDLIEVQASGEEASFSVQALETTVRMAQTAVLPLARLQRQALGLESAAPTIATPATAATPAATKEPSATGR